MFDIEKIFKKRSRLCIVFVVIILIASVFFIYQEYESVINSTFGISADKINFAPFEKSNIMAYRTIKSIDIEIMDSNKFKNLKEVVIKKIKIKVGQNNPFKNPFDLSDEQ